MENKKIITRLTNEKIIPKDSKIINERRNLILMSSTENIVAKIAIKSLTEQASPCDITYGHKISYDMAEQGLPVLQPFEPQPLIIDDIIVSLMPLGQPVDWKNQQPKDIYSLIDTIRTYDNPKMRKLNIPEYSYGRLNKYAESQDADMSLYKIIKGVIDQQNESGDFDSNIYESIHGDLHSENIILHDGQLKIIDLDTASNGKRYYDLASWNLRYYTENPTVNVDNVVLEAKKDSTWDDKLFKRMIGWKAISAMTYATSTINDNQLLVNRINLIGNMANELGAFAWDKL
jgi:hypothetical protein